MPSSASMTRHHIDVLTRELVRHDVEQWWIDKKHHHPRLQFEWQGRPMFFVMPASGSDQRGALNARTDLRRILRG